MRKIKKPVSKSPAKPKIKKPGPSLPSKDSDGGAMGELMPKIKR